MTHHPTSHTRRKSLADIAEAARSSCQRIALKLLGDPEHVTGSETRWRENLSLCLCTAGENRGRWTDFETGEHGDVLDLVKTELSLSTAEAATWLAAELHMQSSEPSVSPSRGADKSRPEERLRDATAVWASSAPLSGSLGEAYLVDRLHGLSVPSAVIMGDALRYCPMSAMPARRCFGGPAGALIARLTDPVSDEFVGIQRTFLNSDATRFAEKDGSRMKPKLLGSSGVVRLWEDAEVTYALGLGEGIETTISGQLLLDGPPSWAALSASNLARFPILGAIEAITVYADADLPDRLGRHAGIDAALSLMQRWQAARPEVEFSIRRPHLEGTDFNDLLSSVMAA